jgi:hypothetical protein
VVQQVKERYGAGGEHRGSQDHDRLAPEAIRQPGRPGRISSNPAMLKVLRSSATDWSRPSISLMYVTA